MWYKNTIKKRIKKINVKKYFIVASAVIQCTVIFDYGYLLMFIPVTFQYKTG